LYEVVQDQSEKCIRLDCIDQIRSHIEDAQQTAIVEQHLKKYINITLPCVTFNMLYMFSVHPGESTQINLWTTESKEPKYTLTIIDQVKGKAKNGQFAVFIVPHGRYIIYILLFITFCASFVYNLAKGTCLNDINSCLSYQFFCAILLLFI